MLSDLQNNVTLKDNLNYSMCDPTIAGLLVAEPQSGYAIDRASWVEVLVDCPGTQGLYTYSLPADLTVRGGDIVSVPFGAQVTGGIVVRLLASPPENLDPKRIRAIEDVITSGFF